MRSVCLMIARLSLAAWIGAAALFVATSIREVRSRQAGFDFEFDSTTRDQLVTLRFPLYYRYGFALVGAGLAAGLAAYGHPALGRWRSRIALALLAIALASMVADYVWVYQPLARMIDPPGGTKPAEFVTYHNASKWINETNVSLVLIAAALLSWPSRREQQGPATASPSGGR
ncbi:MAG TPA: hypothetical protein VML55_04885 [Planctomycetaceae bacterium]|nr:hypothetical protein [Planctomycetaceae bacterium]